MPLRPYQSDLVEQLRAAWREGYKAPCIVLPCGGGKSCILAEIARRTVENIKRRQDACAVAPEAAHGRAAAEGNRRHFDTGLPKGFSDLFGFRIPDGRAFFIEVKSQTGKVRPEQQNFIEQMRSNGALAGIGRSVEDARKIILED